MNVGVAQALTPSLFEHALHALDEVDFADVVVFPAAHNVHVEAFAALYVPAGQFLHAVVPVVFAYVPAGQSVHFDEPAALYVPTGQIVHFDEPAAE